MSGVPLADAGVVRLAAPPAWASVPAPAADVLERVLRTAGARPAHRDPIDARIVQSVVKRTGRIIDSEEQVGGYPVRPMTRHALVVPHPIATRDEETVRTVAHALGRAAWTQLAESRTALR